MRAILFLKRKFDKYKNKMNEYKGMAEKIKCYASGMKDSVKEEINYIDHADYVDEKKNDCVKNVLYNAGQVVVVLAILGLVFQSVWFGCVNGESMLPTYESGSHVILCKKSMVERGDVISFYHDSDVLIKRLIAIEGDSLYIKNGKVFLNGEVIEEPYIQGDSGNMEEIVIPDGYIFVMGDNRDNSLDSRSFGTIPEENIIGEVTYSW